VAIYRATQQLSSGLISVQGHLKMTACGMDTTYRWLIVGMSKRPSLKEFSAASSSGGFPTEFAEDLTDAPGNKVAFFGLMTDEGPGSIGFQISWIRLNYPNLARFELGKNACPTLPAFDPMPSSKHPQQNSRPTT
jgi:hypothetical protein